MKKIIFTILLLVAPLFSLPAVAEESSSSSSAMQDLQNASQDGQEAVAAPTPEEAKVESGETFDTPHDSDGN
ncbi:MAG: hypothetical protein ISR72_00980 [Methylobacter sp.]|nr:hypothetical protein [Methylobacter sp.]